MDPRFLKEEGTEVYTGNELLLKGGLEGRLALLTGYPGSPVSEVFDAARSIQKLLREKGILAEMANNEALSAARLNGAQMANIRAMAVMKSVGLHVAADALALGNLAEHNTDSGALVVVGDDPWMESTQINNDSRYLLMHLHMPVLEPSTFQEIKDWVDLGFDISSRSNLFIGFLLTTPQAEGGGVVRVKPNVYPELNTRTPGTIDTAKIALDDVVLLPPRTWAKEATLEARQERLLDLARTAQINRLLYAPSEGKKPLGFISSGLSYLYLEEALRALGLSGQCPILKLGFSYPMDSKLVEELTRSVDRIVVVEEKRAFLELQLNNLLKDFYQKGLLSALPPVWGKEFPAPLQGFPVQRGLNASVVLERLIPLFESMPEIPYDRERLAQEKRLLEVTAQSSFTIPLRTPTFCPGCPHRDTSSVFLEIKKDFRDPVYMRREHDQKPVDLLFHGGAGCYTMLLFEPNKELMHNYSGMGMEGGTGAGIDPFITNKQVVFMGDSTFFHSGMLAVSDSLKNAQDVTYVILDNKTTAMTGHQPTPGLEEDLMGNKTYAQNIEEVVQGMSRLSGIKVERVNPEFRESYRQMLEDTILESGVKVVIADKECAITYYRKKKRERKKILKAQGYLSEERHINITPEVCEFCLECTKSTGCPGLTIEETAHGPKIATDLTTCVADGACTRGKVCPSFEEVVVTRKAAPDDPMAGMDLDSIPLPAAMDFDEVWRIYTAGVGGMGAGIVSAILVQAAHRQGYHVLFSDKKGLAIRNGGVYGHILFHKKETLSAPLIPYGKADVLLGIDLLEAVRGLDTKVNLRVAGARTVAITNTAKTPTILTLLGKDDFDPALLEETLKTHTDSSRYFGRDLSQLSQRYLGSKLYVNLLLLGVAFQRGVLPLDLDNLLWAIGETVSEDDRRINVRAFQLGRKLVAQSETLIGQKPAQTYRNLLEEKYEILSRKPFRGKALAEGYAALVERAVQSMRLHDASNKHLALRAYDLIQYQGLATARTYLDLVLSVFEKDREEWGFEATRAALWNLHRTMLIKDEVYVAHLLTSPEKRARDKERYHLDERRGDKISYSHLNRPRFVVFGRSIEFNWTSKPWQLQIMKRAKWLRRLLPDWHKEEKEFRDWYQTVVTNFAHHSRSSYDAYVAALRVPETVSGYREIRSPKMIAARALAQAHLTRAKEDPHYQEALAS